MLWGMKILIFILSKAFIYILDLHVNAKSIFNALSRNPYDLLLQ